MTKLEGRFSLKKPQQTEYLGCTRNSVSDKTLHEMTDQLFFYILPIN